MFGHDELLHTLDEIYGQVTTFTAALPDDELRAASRCEGWNVAHVVFHLLGDAQPALISFATPAQGPANADFVSYWRPQEGAEVVAPADHAEFVRRAVAAYQRLSTVLRQWQETANAAVWAARKGDAAAGAVAVTEATFDGLGGARTAGWDSTDYLLKAAGRVPLTDAEQQALGEHAKAMPVLG